MGHSMFGLVKEPLTAGIITDNQHGGATRPARLTACAAKFEAAGPAPICTTSDDARRLMQTATPNAKRENNQ
jgi:hypothetical protein